MLADEHTNFIDEKTGKICLVKCPKCMRENYAMSVLAGICAWCGFDANVSEKQSNEDDSINIAD